jgi:hypothetical protein
MRKFFGGRSRNNSLPPILPRREAETPREKMTFEELAEHEVHCTVVPRCMQYFRHIYAARNRKAGIEALRAQFADFQPRPWQSELLAIHAYKLYWYDYKGNTGKSYVSETMLRGSRGAGY